MTSYRQPRIGTALHAIVATLAPGGCIVIGAPKRLSDETLPLTRVVACPLVYRTLGR